MECNPWYTFSFHVVESQKGMKKYDGIKTKVLMQAHR